MDHDDPIFGKNKAEEDDFLFCNDENKENCKKKPSDIPMPNLSDDFLNDETVQLHEDKLNDIINDINTNQKTQNILNGDFLNGSEASEEIVADNGSEKFEQELENETTFGDDGETISAPDEETVEEALSPVEPEVSVSVEPKAEEKPIKLELTEADNVPLNTSDDIFTETQEPLFEEQPSAVSEPTEETAEPEEQSQSEEISLDVPVDEPPLEELTPKISEPEKELVAPVEPEVKQEPSLEEPLEENTQPLEEIVPKSKISVEDKTEDDEDEDENIGDGDYNFESDDRENNFNLSEDALSDLEAINDDFKPEFEAQRAKEEEEAKRNAGEIDDDEASDVELKPLEDTEKLNDILNLNLENIEEFLKCNKKDGCDKEDKKKTKEKAEPKKIEEKVEVEVEEPVERVKETKKKDRGIRKKIIQNDDEGEDMPAIENPPRRSRNIDNDYSILDTFKLDEDLWDELELSDELREKIEKRIKIEIKSFVRDNVIPVLEKIIK